MEPTEAAILLIALAATWAMTALIWVIQLVHYPIFDSIDPGEDNQGWIQFASRHTSSISIVVGPLMLAEGLTGLWLAVTPPAGVSRVLPIVALGLMAVAYGVTVFVSAPIHGQMSQRFDAQLHHRLVTTNWIRTAAWTTRACVIFALAYIAVT
ncbi:hypothetical protein [uncultured Ilumatobacter sp.]|uniref:hypothetical protein n=1 Tax=uncultured Ilumatobacter sp. TaxID=879968 RepID=UPI00374F4D99